MIRSLVAHPRRINALLGALCLMLVAFAVGLEVLFDMEPCPLCIFQRLVFVAMGVILLLGVLAPGRLVAIATALAALGGVAIAARHLWLQSLPPDQVPACGPGLDYLLGVFPLADVIQMVLSGSGECAEVDRVLGLSIPVWTMAGYVLLGAAAVIVNWQASRGGAGTC